MSLTKNLGVAIDSDLKFDSHIAHPKRKSQRKSKSLT